MATFFAALFLVTGLLLVCAVPVFLVAWRAERTDVTRRFVIAAGGIGLFFGGSAAASKRLVDDCGGSGSIACYDVGYQGFLLLVVTVYIITSLMAAYVLSRQ